MKILFIDLPGKIGGAQKSSLLFLRELRKKGLEFHSIVFGEGEYSAALSKLGRISIIKGGDILKFSRYKPKIKPEFFKELFDISSSVALICKQSNPDIIYTNSLKTHIIGSIVSVKTKKALVWHFRDIVFPSYFLPMYNLLAITSKAKIITVSKFVSKQFIKSEVVYNPVDFDLFNPYIKPSLNFGKKVIGYVANFTPWKGHKVFIDVAKMLSRREDIIFLICGGDIYETLGNVGYYDEVLKYAKQTENVKILGFREDINSVMASFDCLVHTPLKPEPFGRVITEAQSMGKLCIAGRKGGISEIIFDKINGILVDDKDIVRKISEQIVYNIDNPEFSERLKRNAQNFARLLFNPYRCSEKLLNVFKAAKNE